LVFARDDLGGLSLPFDRRIEVRGRPGVPEAAADLELLHVAPDLLTDDQARFVGAVDLGQLRTAGNACRHQPGASFAVIGFPFDRKGIDYEEHVISLQRVIHAGALDRSQAEGRIHILSLETPRAHESMNGMSGSPVFSFVQTAGEVCPSFDGVVVLGPLDGTAEVAFICARVVFDVLDQAVDDLDEG
jgi:hypothetical protein